MEAGDLEINRSRKGREKVTCRLCLWKEDNSPGVLRNKREEKK
jgi:hypothetical protein